MKALNIQRCLLYVSAFLYTLVANADTHNLTFNLSDFEIEQRDGVVSITPVKPAYTFGLDTSSPALPLYTQRITIDGKSQKGTFTYVVNSKELIASNVYVSPNKECYATNRPVPVDTSVVLPDYGQQVYPEKTAGFIYGTTLRDGKEISFLTVSPFEYDAANGNLYFISSISLSFDKEVRMPSRQATTRTNNKVVKYLIVTSESFVDAFKPLRDWKTQKGMKAEIISTEAIDSIYEDEGADIQERIKRCLKDYYDNYSLDWVLLGGDDSAVPVRKCYIANDSGMVTYRTIVASDAYYANFEGAFNWNADNDGYYGEVEDSVYLTPQIKVSRLPFRNESQIEAYTEKLINYEKALYAGPWMNRMLLSGRILKEYKDSGISDAHDSTEKLYENYIQSSYPDLEKHYFYDTGNSFGYTETDSILGVYNFARTFNTVEPHYMHMATHGSSHLWELDNDSLFASSHVLSLLTNNNKPVIVTTEACNASDFVDQPTPGMCEAFLMKANGGALAFWGSSFKGIIGISDDFCGNFWENLSKTYYRFADAVIAARCKYANHYNKYDHARTLMLSMHAMGDPELTVYTNETTHPNEHFEIKFYPDSVFAEGLRTDSLTTTSLGDNGETFYKDAFCYAGGSTTEPVLVCVKREGYYILTVESGHNYWKNGYNTLYLQGQTYLGGKISYASDVIAVGNDVDSTQTQGNVVVKQGTLTFDSSVRTVIQNGFKCEKGARLIIK